MICTCARGDENVKRKIERLEAKVKELEEANTAQQEELERYKWAASFNIDEDGNERLGG